MKVGFKDRIYIKCIRPWARKGWEGASLPQRACAAETFPGFSHPPSGMRSSLSESSQSTQGNVVCRKSRSFAPT